VGMGMKFITVSFSTCNLYVAVAQYQDSDMSQSLADDVSAASKVCYF